MTPEERAALGRRIADERGRRYGTKSAAYGEAKVNSATWDKAEQGQVVREDRLRQIIRTLWPDTGGDWRKVPDADSSDSGPAFTWDDFDQLGPRLNGVDRQLDALWSRVDDLEQQVRALVRHSPRTVNTLSPVSSADEHDIGPEMDRTLPTAASKARSEPSVNKRRRRQDEAGEASQDDGDMEPR